MVGSVWVGDGGRAGIECRRGMWREWSCVSYHCGRSVWPSTLIRRRDSRVLLCLSCIIEAADRLGGTDSVGLRVVCGSCFSDSM